VSAAAYLAHRLPGRARLKFPAHRGNSAFFVALARSLEPCPGIIRTVGKVETGSLLILHEAAIPLESILDFARAERLFVCTAEPVNSAPPPAPGQTLGVIASQGLASVESAMMSASKGRIDLPTFYFLSFLALGVRELALGHVMPPTLTLWWRSVEILAKLNRSERGNGDGL
jgi:hypothetical protein